MSSPLSWNWVQWLLGVGGDGIPAGADMRLTWTNLPQSWRVFAALFILAALISAAAFVYRLDAARLSVTKRRLLAGLRIAVVLLLALVALGPALAHHQLRVLQPVVVVLRDSSQSMNIADGSSGDSQSSTRAEVVGRLFGADAGGLLAALHGRGQLRVLDFAESVRPVELRADGPPQSESSESGAASTAHAPLPALVPEGVGTNLHRALSEALAERFAAAIVVFTDGQHTDRGTRKDDLLALAGQARSRGVPLLIVGVGDPSRPRNLQVSGVFADAQVWKDDPFELQALLHSEGFGGETARVSLVEQRFEEEADAPAAEQVLETRDVPLAEGEEQTRLTFTHIPAAAGRFAFTVRVEPVEGESSLDDNQPSVPAEVKVIDERARVLLVAGGPNWDYRFVRQLLELENSIEVSCWLQTLDADRGQEGDAPITHLPRTKEELFAYDLVLLLDPDPREFDEPWIELLGEFLTEHAGGLLYMAGPAFTSRFVTGTRTNGIRALLPVRFGDTMAAEVSSLLETNDREWPLELVPSALDEPLMRFEHQPLESEKIWNSLPGITWSFPAEGTVPAARVLIEHSDPALAQLSGPRPLLVTGHSGAGRTVYLGFDGTWRWRQAGRNAEYFNRFWLQAMRYLTEGRMVEGKRRGTLETDRTRYEVGDRITVVARLTDAQFAPLEQAEVSAELQVAGEEPLPVTLRSMPQQPGRYEAAVTARRAGRHVLQIRFPEGTGAGVPNIETTFSVFPPSAETQRPWQDQPLLQELAAASGGRYFEPAEAADLPVSIPSKEQTLLVQGKPVPLWDTNRVLFLVVGLLTCEWGLRKRFKLL